jgi:tetratricopeptide (TPR) repeat protein/tRNA A-37 threonylcarbamoyl transferase component Bud32
VPPPETPTLDDSGLVAEKEAWAPAARPAVAQRGESFGRYVVLREIGSGGMGVVYAAYDPELDRRVALKVLGQAASEETGRARLLREAQTMASISHPNVITVHDVGEVEGRLFIAMELVDGVDLKQWLSQEEHTWSQVLEFLVQAGRGLAAAHAQGLIHRDFKPANVLVGNDGLVRVLDFGLARRFGSASEEVHDSDTGDIDDSSSSNSHTEQLTRTGAVAGTPAYMSPEQHARADLDAKSDQFSYCITAFEALFGMRPFEGKGRMTLMLATTQGDRRPVPKSTPVPSWVADAVLRGLEPKPADRWPTMDALLEQLERAPTSRRTIALGGLAALTLGGVVAASLGDDSEAPCAGLDDPSAVFDADARKAVEDAFRASDVPYAERALEHALGVLDGYAEGWAETRHDACEATRVRRDRSETVHDLSVACLDRHRRDFEATATVLAEADATTVEKSAGLLEQLPPLQACTDVESLVAAYPAPEPEQREAVAAAETVLARGRALLGARRDGQALEALRKASEAADASGYLPTMAAAAFELAVVLNFNAKREEALPTFHRAAQLATQVGDARLLAQTWTEMATHIALAESGHEEAFRWFDYAEAVLPRVPNSFRIEVRLRQSRGTALSELGRLDEAIAELGRLDERREPGAARTHEEELLLGNIYTWKADYDAAAGAFDRAGVLLQKSHGEDHPLFATVHNGRGVVAFSRGDLATAEVAFRDAYETLAAILPATSPELLFSLGNMAEIQRMRGDFEKACPSMLEVERIVEASFPAVHREAGTTNNNIATCLQEWGKAEESLPRFDAAIDIRRQVHGERHLYVANSLTGKGRALLDLDRAAEALPLLEEAYSIRGETEAPPRKRARTEFALARALASTGGDAKRARTLARDALAGLKAQDDATVADRVTAIEAWLDANGGDAPKGPSRP